MSNTKYGFIGGKEPTQGGASNSGVFSTSDVQDLVIDGNYGLSYITSNLILHLDSIGYTSGNWADISGNGGSATLSNGATFDSTNKEIDYDGTNDYSRFSRSDVNGGSWAYGQATFEFWVKPSASNDAASTSNNIFTVEDSFEISFSPDGTVSYASNPWAWRSSGTGYLSMATYNQLVYVHSSSYRRMFVNGTQIYNNSGETGNLEAGNSSYPYITLMGRNVGTNSNAAGSLSIVRVYSRVLSNAEVLLNYNSQKGRFGLS